MGSVTFFKIPCFSMFCIASAALSSLATEHRWRWAWTEVILWFMKIYKSGPKVPNENIQDNGLGYTSLRNRYMRDTKPADTTQDRFLFGINCSNTFISTVRGDWINTTDWAWHNRCKLLYSSILEDSGCNVTVSSVTVPLSTWLKLVQHDILAIPGTRNWLRSTSFYLNQPQLDTVGFT